MRLGFENIASIFSQERLRRHCAIVTDMDAEVEGADKSKVEAAKRGKSRKEKLEKLFGRNIWVHPFYAPHTFEVDFANIDNNREYIKKIIKKHYKQESTIKRHVADLDSSDAARYDSVLIVANGIGKGWYATLLASKVDDKAIIPDYLLDAMVYASQDIINFDMLWKIFVYRFASRDDGESIELQKQLSVLTSREQRLEAISKFVEKHPKDMFSIFYLKHEELINDI